MHNGFVRVDEEKMSKSLGNFFTVRDMLKKYDPEVVRFFILRAHYRSPLNYSDQHLDDAQGRVDPPVYGSQRREGRQGGGRLGRNHTRGGFKEAMDDDFGTPEAVAVLFDLANRVNAGDTALAAQLCGLGGVLGLLQREPMSFLQARPAGVSEEWISGKIAEREAARQRKDYAAADRIRKELSDSGITLEDKGGKTTWRRT